MGRQASVVADAGTPGIGALVYLDTNVLIRMTEGRPDEREALRAAMAPYVMRAARFVTSELTLTEVLVHPIRFDDTALIGTYERLLTEFVEALPVSREVLVLAAQLRADTPAQRTPDAIHAATAILAKADVFVSGDKGFRNLPAPMAHVVV